MLAGRVPGSILAFVFLFIGCHQPPPPGPGGPGTPDTLPKTKIPIGTGGVLDFTPDACADPEDRPPGAPPKSEFGVGEIIESNGLKLEVSQFPGMNQFPGIDDGKVHVFSDLRAGGSGEEYSLDRAVMELQIDVPLRHLRLSFGYYGPFRVDEEPDPTTGLKHDARPRVEVNGHRLSYKDAQSNEDLKSMLGSWWDPTSHPEVAILAEPMPPIPGHPHPEWLERMGRLHVYGSITQFSIGGDELAIDELCVLTDGDPVCSEMSNLMNSSSVRSDTAPLTGTWGIPVALAGPDSRKLVEVRVGGLDTTGLTAADLKVSIYGGFSTAPIDSASTPLAPGQSDLTASVQLTVDLVSGTQYLVAVYVDVPDPSGRITAFLARRLNNQVDYERQLVFRLIPPLLRISGDAYPDPLGANTGPDFPQVWLCTTPL